MHSCLTQFSILSSGYYWITLCVIQSILFMKLLRMCWTWVAYRKISKTVFDHQCIINEQIDIEIAFSNIVCMFVSAHWCVCVCTYEQIWCLFKYVSCVSLKLVAHLQIKTKPLPPYICIDHKELCWTHSSHITWINCFLIFWSKEMHVYIITLKAVLAFC